MAVRTLSEDIDNLYTTTWQNMKGEAADQIFDATPFWFWLKAHGQLDPVEGGRFLTEPLRYAKSDNARWVKKGSSMPLSDKEFLTVAQYEWRYLADSIVRFGQDDQQNRGRNEIINLMEGKLATSQDTLIDVLEDALFDDDNAAAGDGSPINSLDELVADAPEASLLVGGIQQSSNTWWRNQEFDHGTIGFLSNGQDNMSTMLNDCGNNLRQDMTDIILSGQTPYEVYEQMGVAQIQVIAGKQLLDMGFPVQEYKGVPMIWSPQCANTRMYFLNTRFLRFKYDPMMFFDMTEWKPIVNQINDRAAQIVLAGNLVTGRRRVHGVIHTIDTFT